jgi:hypothetical protein
LRSDALLKLRDPGGGCGERDCASNLTNVQCKPIQIVTKNPPVQQIHPN